MIATDFTLTPLAVLHNHEATVRARLDGLPFTYRKNLLHVPETRYPFLYYMLFTHWPELLGGDLTREDVLYNRLYWFYRLKNRDLHNGFAQQARQLLEASQHELGPEVVHSLADKVEAELATNEKEIAVSFSEFSISDVKRLFGLQIEETENLFANVAPVPVSQLLQETLQENIAMALAVGTEKARSEFIIAPVLAEVRRQMAKTISLFSGVEIDVDPARGLRGVCDFLLCRSPHQFLVEAPVIAVVEAKKEDMSAGIGQCLAEMVAARIFNQRNQSDIPAIHGIVTSGSTWKFLRLVNATAHLDTSEYYIKEVERIVGIIVAMVRLPQAEP